MLKILFTGGATGGHIYPIIAVARDVKLAAKKNNIPVELLFAGPADFNLELLRQEGISTYRVPAGKFRRYVSWRAPLDALKAVGGFFYALALVWWIMPDVIFAKGGYGGFSVAFVGRIYAIPLLVHDSDSVPGLANRILGAVATRVAISFPTAAKYFSAKKTAYVGNPVRSQLLLGSKEKAKTLFGLKADRPLILVLGGSQGSTRLNTIIAASLKELLPSYEVLHQAGSLNTESFLEELREIYGVDHKGEEYYHIKGYFSEEEVASALGACDIVVSRAGAGSIFEIAAWGKPSVLIPLQEAASDHQRANAFFYARAGAAVVIEEANLSPHILLSEIESILKNKNRQLEMSKAAKEFSKQDAAKKIAEGLLELAL